MKTRNQKLNRSESAYALITVLVMAGVGIAIYASVARWTASNVVINDRNNVYNSAVAAAEGASETVLSYLARDFFNQSYSPGNMTYYRALLPTNDWAARYAFSDNAGGSNQTWVSSTPNTVMTNLNSQFTGLYGLVYDCTVVSQARPLNTPYSMAAVVRQDLQLASIPVFQYAIFYAMDLEVNPGAPMKVTGKVHCNANLYTAPPSTLEYGDDVTAVGKIYNNRAPGDPTGGSKTTPIYDREHADYASSLTLPIGTNNSPDAVRAILQVPPFGENPLSQVGQERYCNQTDLIVTTTATNIIVKSGNWNSFTVIAPDVAGTTNTPPQYSFIKTNASFYDQRENKNTVTTDIDVAALNTWLTNGGNALNNQAKFQMGHQINSVYINDQRVQAGKLTTVRVTRGQQLPPDGLTVATVLPLYVQGHFNAPNTTVGYTNTSATKPASLLGDSITVLSVNWVDTNSSKALGSRPALDTTVNAAFLAGIVPTTTANGGHYSGGVENFPRFLEDWSSRSFTYNGSMVVMFPSQYSTNYWVQTGTYYNAPGRKWAFDVNFLDYRKLPPATPMVRKLVRGQWNVVAAH